MKEHTSAWFAPERWYLGCASGSWQVGHAKEALDLWLAQDGHDAPFDGRLVENVEVGEEGHVQDVFIFGALGELQQESGDSDGFKELPALGVPRGTHLDAGEPLAERLESVGEDIGCLVLRREQDGLLGPALGAPDEVDGDDALGVEQAGGNVLSPKDVDYFHGQRRVSPSFPQLRFLFWGGWEGPFFVVVLDERCDIGCVGAPDDHGLGARVLCKKVKSGLMRHDS